MKTLFIIPLILLSLITTSGCRQDVNKGIYAYNRGDYQEALGKWTPLAEQGHAPAQFNLGVMYDKGDGVHTDYIYARMWYNIAASLGNYNASQNRHDVAKRMTPPKSPKPKGLPVNASRKTTKIADWEER